MGICIVYEPTYVLTITVKSIYSKRLQYVCSNFYKFSLAQKVISYSYVPMDLIINTS